MNRTFDHSETENLLDDDIDEEEDLDDDIPRGDEGPDDDDIPRGDDEPDDDSTFEIDRREATATESTELRLALRRLDGTLTVVPEWTDDVRDAVQIDIMDDDGSVHVAVGVRLVEPDEDEEQDGDRDGDDEGEGVRRLVIEGVPLWVADRIVTDLQMTPIAGTGTVFVHPLGTGRVVVEILVP